MINQDSNYNYKNYFISLSHDNLPREMRKGNIMRQLKYTINGNNNASVAQELLRPIFPKPSHFHKMSENINSHKKEVEEIRITFPWGQIAGKWWGPQNVRPIVGLHGWQDNAATFDTLAPLLPPHISFLSLDLPGHGLSSRLPDGLFYNSIDGLHLLNLICKEYNWDKISLMAHSMGSIMAFLYSAVFPEKVDMLIALDALKPHIRDANKIAPTLQKRLENFIIADKRNQERTEPPSYSYEELVEKLHLGTFGSVSKESCQYLLSRAISKSSKYPDKYYFTRDSRLKYFNYIQVSQDVCIELAKRLKTPYLFIKASDSPYYEDKKYFDEIIELLQTTNKNFQFHTVQGSHHVHLNDPTKVSGIINDFINKYRPPQPPSKL